MRGGRVELVDKSGMVQGFVVVEESVLGMQ